MLDNHSKFFYLCAHQIDVDLVPVRFRKIEIYGEYGNKLIEKSLNLMKVMLFWIIIDAAKASIRLYYALQLSDEIICKSFVKLVERG
jgi:hypothetical protein